MEHLGQDGFLHCRAAGHPKPTILWFQGDHTEPIKTEESETSRYQILPTGDLLIRNSTFDDMNVYRCMAQNEFGSDSVDQIFFYPTLVSDLQDFSHLILIEKDILLILFEIEIYNYFFSFYFRQNE